MLLDLVVCDDVRTEVGDKSTLVGVYSDVIRLGIQGASQVPWPVMLPKLGVFLRTKPMSEFVPKQFALTFTHNGNPIGKFEGNMTVLDPNRPITLAVVASPFPIPGPGAIQFHLVFKNGDQVKQVPIERTLAVELAGEPH